MTLSGGRHPLLVRMLQELLQVVRHLRVEDVEELVPGRTPVLRIDGREVGADDRVLLHLWPECLDGKLVILRNVDVVDLGLHEELLIPGEDVLEEVIVDGTFRRQIALN